MTREQLEKAMREAYRLGQVYCEQADSEYVSHNRKSEQTAIKFESLVDDTIKSIWEPK